VAGSGGFSFSWILFCSLGLAGTGLVLLHHKFLREGFLAIRAAQHGHRDRVLTSATINRRRMVATEFGM
jgi:hypothetical protein